MNKNELTFEKDGYEYIIKEKTAQHSAMYRVLANTEEEARKLFRKWDNVKHIGEVIRPKARAKKVYENKLWGMSIKTKERLQPRDGEGIRFGVVVTLREMNGVNRIEDFIQQCSLRGWLVNRLNVEQRIDVYHTAEETVEFE